MIYAAIFNAARQPIKLMTTNRALQLNVNCGPGDEWREIPPGTLTLEAVPPFEVLPPHPEFEPVE